MPNHVLAFRTKAVESELAEAANVRAAKETGLRLESLRSVLIQGVVFHLARAVLDVFPKVRPALVYAAVEIGGADERLHRGVPSGTESDLCVDAADAIGADDAAIIAARGVGHGSKLAVGVDQTDGGLFADIAIHAKHTEIGFGTPERVSGSNRAARRIIVREEGAEGPGTRLAGEAKAIIGIGDAASKDEIDGSGEVACVFEKEWTLLRKENFEALIDGDLRLVGSALGKIGMQRGVEDQGILDDEFGIEAGARFETLPVKMGHAAGAIVEAAARRSEERRV